MRFLNKIVLNAVDLSMNQSSVAIFMGFGLQVSAQGVITGTSPNGTLKLQCSNDILTQQQLDNGLTPTNWSDIPSGSVSVSGSTGVYLIPKVDTSYTCIRLVWVASVWVHSNSTRK